MISGQRGAPGGLHRLYPRLRGIPVGIGSYEAVSGTPDKLGPPEQTLLGAVQVLAPAGPYTVWAERSGTSAFAEESPKNRLLYPLNEQQLLAAEKMIGEPAGFLAVFADAPVNGDAAEQAFADTRYRWLKTEAVYAQADPNRVPKIQFIHWAELRPIEEWQGRSAGPRAAATRLGGVLVFPVPMLAGPGDREAPQSTFAAAFDGQFSGGVVTPRVVSAPEGPGDVRQASAQQRATVSLLVMGIFGCGVLATWAGYRLMRSAQGAPA